MGRNDENALLLVALLAFMCGLLALGAWGCDWLAKNGDIAWVRRLNDFCKRWNI